MELFWEKIITPLNEIKNSNGSIVKIYPNSQIKEIGHISEIYLNKVLYNQIKGWNYHISSKIFIKVISGKIQLSLCNKEIVSMEISESDLYFIKIDSKTWFKFQGLFKLSSTILVFSELLHDKNEVIKLEPSLNPLKNNTK